MKTFIALLSTTCLLATNAIAGSLTAVETFAEQPRSSLRSTEDRARRVTEDFFKIRDGALHLPDWLVLHEGPRRIELEVVLGIEKRNFEPIAVIEAQIPLREENGTDPVMLVAQQKAYGKALELAAREYRRSKGAKPTEPRGFSVDTAPGQLGRQLFATITIYDERQPVSEQLLRAIQMQGEQLITSGLEQEKLLRGLGETAETIDRTLANLAGSLDEDQAARDEWLEGIALSVDEVGTELETLHGRLTQLESSLSQNYRGLHTALQAVGAKCERR